ncbi:hypothetical protein H632_c1682p0 [Helicosporidium sp. ATCC 50920]|nr:hypothetical protein H632_c1682p0 [Helicosporidium sp. ATCC 50920]|eukprot:KDD73977.1 hypothetical protein H632_c1682p0 [Helicosporidium sp. ATCC 50920]
MVGLDVESSQRRLHLGGAKLAQRRFSAAERAHLESRPTEASRNAAFLELWTLKEALVKALGRGINQPPGLASFTFDVRASGAGDGLSLRFRQGRAPASEDPAAEHAWAFWQWEEPGGFLAAACAGGQTLSTQQPDALRIFDVDVAAAFETEAGTGAALERPCRARMGLYIPERCS